MGVIDRVDQGGYSSAKVVLSVAYPSFFASASQLACQYLRLPIDHVIASHGDGCNYLTMPKSSNQRPSNQSTMFFASRKIWRLSMNGYLFTCWQLPLSVKTGLGAFFHRRRLPGVDSPLCPCGQGPETPKHVLIHCERYQTVRGMLEDSGRVDIKDLLCTEEGARKLPY